MTKPNHPMNTQWQNPDHAIQLIFTHFFPDFDAKSKTVTCFVIFFFFFFFFFFFLALLMEWDALGSII
jgi:hypothetical protein